MNSGIEDRTWVVRLRPVAAGGVDGLLRTPMQVDVWAREPDALIVAVSERTLAELERRGIATGEKISTTEEYVRREGRVSR